MRLRLLNRAALAVMLVAASLLSFGASSRAADAPHAKNAPIIVFMTDYGLLDDAVAICKGVMLTIAPDARIVDLTHQVTPYSVADGARFLARASLYFPANTVFVGVVDPGVGTARRAIIAKSRRGQYFVVPDNGLLTPIQDRDGIESAREIKSAAWMLPEPHSATFHGRDIFAPAAAHLARGEDWSNAGPVIPQLVRMSVSTAAVEAGGINGHVVGLDGPFGNLITDVKGRSLQHAGLQAWGQGESQAWGQRTFGAVCEHVWGCACGAAVAVYRLEWACQSCYQSGELRQGAGGCAASDTCHRDEEMKIQEPSIAGRLRGQERRASSLFSSLSRPATEGSVIFNL